MGIVSVILAAGKGTRMKSESPKVLFQAAGKSMIDYVLDTCEEAGIERNIVITGSSAEAVEAQVSGRAETALQKEQKGTADAVLAAKEALNDYSGKVMILCGDMPLIKPETLTKFIEESENHSVSFISVKVKNPSGYGRVVRGMNGSVIAITEEKDADERTKKINEINTGVYLCDAEEMFRRLDKIDNNNAQGEYYLTDIVKDGVFAFAAKDEDEFIGVNNRVQLAQVSKIIWKRRAEKIMMDGVSILDPDTFYADDSVEIGIDSVIYPNVWLSGNTVIGAGCEIHSGCRIEDSIIEDGCEIKDNCLITDSFVGAESSVGPMAQLRPGSKLCGRNKIGNFVETKKAVLGLGSKASHLTYLGDAEIGADVNIGCGTITCNYDGINKYKTEIGDGVFVGSDVQLVAPVKIGKDALIAAGSTITKDVPEGALAITRADQKNTEGWVARWKKAKTKGK